MCELCYCGDELKKNYVFVPIKKGVVIDNALGFAPSREIICRMEYEIWKPMMGRWSSDC